MIGVGLSLPSRAVLGGGAFSPARLFGSAEPGAWYDPSDVANLSWRRNLLTYSEQFDNAIWQKVGATLAVNTGIAPGGTTTADQLIESATADRHVIYWTNLSVTNGIAYTWSVYLKSYGARYAVIGFDTVSNPRVFVDLLDGIVTDQVNGATGSITAAGNGWYRVSCTAVTTGASMYPQIGISDRATYGEPLSFAMPYYTGDGTSGLYIWGAQLELGSTATEYQRITDVHTEVRERFPNATLFQDTAGTQPVTTAAQSVALMLDKSRGLTLGPELVTNGDFSDGTTGWTLGAGVTVVSGQALWSSAATNSRLTAAGLTLDAAKTYHVSVEVVSITEGSLGTLIAQFSAGAGIKTFFLTGVTSFALRSYGTTTAVVSNISVRELPGNHATQAITASRPIYAVEPTTGRRNLLTYSEQFDNAAWIKANFGLIAPNVELSPDGTTTADKLILTSGQTNAPQAFQGITVTSGTNYTLSVYAKAAEIETVVFLGGGSLSGAGVRVNLINGNLISTVSPGGLVFSEILPAYNGFYHIRIVVTANSTGTGTFLVRATNPDGSAFLGDGTSGIYIWGAQLELGSTATAYQRVVSKYDVTEAGVPSRSYLSFDGIDDFMVTPTITPGIDKAQVFAGVRKLSDVSAGTIIESSATWGTNPGTLLLRGPRSNSSAGYGFYSAGSNTATAPIDVGYATPITNILTGIGDISGDSAVLRINGAQAASSTADQGTGNFGNYPLYIGRRGGVSLPFNGNIYGLLVRFGANLSNSQVIAAERWLNNKTGAY